MRPITDVLREMRKGRIVEDATEALAEVVKAVDQTNKAGSVTIKITVKPSKDGGWEKTLSASVDHSVPRQTLPDAVFFSTADGDLVRDDPEQKSLFEGAEVPFLFKQWGDWTAHLDRDVQDPDWRADYRRLETGPYRWLNLAGGLGFHGERFHVMRRVGKRAAGRMLDGRIHDGFPTGPENETSGVAG